jgi:hypothetical protein
MTTITKIDMDQVAQDILSVQPMTGPIGKIYAQYTVTCDQKPLNVKDGVWIYQADGIWACTNSTWFVTTNFSCPGCKNHLGFDLNWIGRNEMRSYNSGYEIIGIHGCGTKIGLSKK